MCWVYYNFISKPPQKLRATKDIRAFKIAFVDEHGTVIPYYYSDLLVYEEKKSYHSSLDEPILLISESENDTLSHYIINHGLHSYNAEKCKFVIRKTSATTLSIVVLDNSETFLGSFNIGQILTGKLTVMDCSIPKDSAYYENEYGEMVSDALRIDKMTIVDLNTEPTNNIK